MKTLLLLRHAKSSRDDDTIDDFDRPLNSRGEKAAPRVGELMSEHGLVPDRVLSSSAVRALSTARAAAQACDFQGTVAALDSLYLAAPSAYLAALARLPDEVTRPLVVGHNPGIEELVRLVTGKAEHMPTAALAVIDVEIERWADLDASARGKLRTVFRPRESD